jgi:putative component of toxin-antitoxin plasmid stabilization module
MVSGDRRIQDRLGAGSAHLFGEGRSQAHYFLGGGTKKRQQKDIEEAVALWNDYKRRKSST